MQIRNFHLQTFRLCKVWLVYFCLCFTCCSLNVVEISQMCAILGSCFFALLGAGVSEQQVQTLRRRLSGLELEPEEASVGTCMNSDRFPLLYS